MPPERADAVQPADIERSSRDERLAGCLSDAARGDASAFERFYDDTHACAQALARRLLRGGEIDDVVADAFFQAWREAPRFDPARGSAITFLLVRVRSRAIDTLRARPPMVDGEAAEAALTQLVADAPGPDELLALAEAGTRLHQALLALSPHERWVLGLAYFRDLSLSQIASATGLPLGTVKSLAQRAQHKLRAPMQA